MSSPADMNDADKWLAAEYALGVLDRDASKAAALRCETDADFRNVVEGWQNQLSPMLDEVEEVSPPGAAWKNILAATGQAPVTAERLPQESGGIWKLLTAFTTTAALASLAALFVITGGDFSGSKIDSLNQQVAEFETRAEVAEIALEDTRTQLETLSGERDSALQNAEAGREAAKALELELEATQQALDSTRSQLVEVTEQIQRTRPLVATLTKSGELPPFIAQYNPLNKSLLINTTLSDEDERVPEVWLIPAQGERKDEVLSLGVVDEAAPDTIAVDESFVPLIGAGGTLAITLEPPGGAPNGVATGPIIAIGKLQAFE